MGTIKKSIILALALVIMSATTVFAATTMYVKGDNVRVRSTPTTSSKSNIVGSVNKGDVCTVISENGEWTEVSVNGLKGYIRNDFIQTKRVDSSRTTKSSSVSKNTLNSNVINVTETSPQSNAEMVWIPTKGGKKIHSRSGCSGMENPAYVTIDEANKRGFYDYCKKCY